MENGAQPSKNELVAVVFERSIKSGLLQETSNSVQVAL